MAKEPDLELFFRAVGRRSWRLFKEDPALYLLAAVITVLLGALSLGILAGPLLVGFVMLVNKRMAGQKASPWDVFDGFRRFVTAFLVFVVVALGISIGMFLLVIPGLLVAWVTMFAWPAIALRDEDFSGAFSHSYRLVRANPVNTIMLLLVLALVNAAGGSIVFGAILSVPITVLALTVAFDELVAKPPDVRKEPSEKLEPTVLVSRPPPSNEGTTPEAPERPL